MRLDYGLYMAEAEGLLKTRQGRYNAAKSEVYETFIQQGREISDIQIYNIFYRYDLHWIDDLTQNERDRVRLALK